MSSPFQLEDLGSSMSEPEGSVRDAKAQEHQPMATTQEHVGVLATKKNSPKCQKMDPAFPENPPDAPP